MPLSKPQTLSKPNLLPRTNKEERYRQQIKRITWSWTGNFSRISSSIRKRSRKRVPKRICSNHWWEEVIWRPDKASKVNLLRRWCQERTPAKSFSKILTLRQNTSMCRLVVNNKIATSLWQIWTLRMQIRSIWIIRWRMEGWLTWPAFWTNARSTSKVWEGVELCPNLNNQCCNRRNRTRTRL